MSLLEILKEYRAGVIPQEIRGNWANPLDQGICSLLHEDTRVSGGDITVFGNIRRHEPYPVAPVAGLYEDDCFDLFYDGLAEEELLLSEIEEYRQNRLDFLDKVIEELQGEGK